jgi:hypothetical protein
MFSMTLAKIVWAVGSKDAYVFLLYPPRINLANLGGGQVNSGNFE